MAMKALNIKMDEVKINDLKSVSAVFHMTITDFISEALDEYMEKMKKDPFYILTSNIQDADEDESEEILKEINAMTADDLSISSTHRFDING